MKIDTEKWGEFEISKFFDAERGKVKNLQKLEEGNVPVVAAAGYKEGVAGYYNVPMMYENKITVSCNGAGCGSTFYHNYGFNIAGDALVLIEKWLMSDDVKCFITCVLNGILTKRYSYNEKCSPDKISEEVIKLPIDKNGNPDWLYMENYMKSIEAKVKSALQKLEQAKIGKSKLIDVTQWKEFEIKDLFGKLDLKILKKDFNKKTDVSLEHNQEFNLPLVNAKHFNNGIMFYGREKDFESAEMTLDIVKNGAVATGDVYAQPQKTGVLWDAYLVKPLWDCQSAYVLHYMACVIECCIKSHFSWNDKCVWDRVKQEKIKLPVDKQGNPDWKYMEDYMRQVEKRVQNNLQYLRSAV